MTPNMTKPNDILILTVALGKSDSIAQLPSGCKQITPKSANPCKIFTIHQ